MGARIVLLRGINVGGKARLPMAELGELLAELSFAGAKTLLQTGNAVLNDARPAAQLEALLEAAIEQRFGFRPDVMVRTAPEWSAMVAANPFSDAAMREPNRLIAVVLKTAPDPVAIEALRAAAVLERVEVIGRTAYVHYPRGQGDSRLSVEGKLKVRGAGRNWNTVLKLAALAGG